MMPQIFDCEQGSSEWLRCRLGVPSASNFSAILAKGEGKTRRSYLYKLAAERLTGEPTESYTNPYMERGKIMEDEARDLYAFLCDEPLTRVGFIKNCDVGCSPDSLVGNKGGLEIKTQRGDLLIDTLLKDEFPPEHKAQVQGNLLVSEREWWDLCVYWPRLPLFKKRVYRDDVYIDMLEKELQRFLGDLDSTVASLRTKYGEAG